MIDDQIDRRMNTEKSEKKKRRVNFSGDNKLRVCVAGSLECCRLSSINA